MPRSEERGGMAARSEAEINSLLVYKSHARKGGALYFPSIRRPRSLGFGGTVETAGAKGIVDGVW